MSKFLAGAAKICVDPTPEMLSLIHISIEVFPAPVSPTSASVFPFCKSNEKRFDNGK